MGHWRDVVIFSLVVVAMQCASVVGRRPVDEKIFNNVQVNIKNELGANQSLWVHCRSNEDDIGEHVLYNWGELEWHFRVNMWGSTCFYCDAVWLGAPFEPTQFHAYDGEHDWDRCLSLCHWRLTPKGIYQMNEQTGLWERMFPWWPK